MTTREIIAAFERGAHANRHDPHRVGNLIHLSAPGQVIMTGDLHGNVANFERIVRYTDLENRPNRHLILHEILHGGPAGLPDQCQSYLLLARAAQLKVQFPSQVHFLLSNHEIAQAVRSEVLKSGQAMVRAVNNAIAASFADKSALVQKAMEDFIISMPLAIRTENRIWLSHSLPSASHLEYFEQPQFFDKTLTIDDLTTDPGVHALTWDRVHSRHALERLGGLLHADVFIIGHKPQATGYGTEGDSLIVIASDHPQGCLLPFTLDRNYSRESLLALIQPLASLS